MTFRLGRRQFLMGSSALLAAGSMAPPVFAQGAPLRLIWWGGQARADRTLAVADAFAAATGSPEPQGEFLAWNDYWTRLATQVAGGNAPDVIQMDYRFIVEYATRNAIAPLDEFVGGALKLDDFDEDQLEGGKVDGKLYGLSLGANSVATMINTTAFEEVGIEPPTLAWSYEDIPEIGEAFLGANIRGGMKAMSDGSGNEPSLDNWIRQRGKPLYTPEGKLGPDVDDMVEWFRMWNGFRDAGYIVAAEDQALDTGAPEVSMLALNKAALLPSNSNQLVIHQSINPDTLSMTSYPRIAPGVGGGHYRKPSQFWSISGSSSNKEHAAEFLSYFVNDIEAGKVLGVERGIPCSAAVREAVSPLLSEQDQIALNFVANLGDLLGPLPPSPPNAAGEIDVSLLRTLSQEVAFGGRSAEDAGRFFVEEANAILERAAAT